MTNNIPRKWEYLSQQLAEMFGTYKVPVYEELHVLSRRADESIYKVHGNIHTRNWIASEEYTTLYAKEYSRLHALQYIMVNPMYCTPCVEVRTEHMSLLSCSRCQVGKEVGICMDWGSLYKTIIGKVAKRLNEMDRE